LEDIPYYNVIVRSLTEWTGTNQSFGIDQTSINEGIGGVSFGCAGRNAMGAPGAGAALQGAVNIRQAYIQGVDFAFIAADTSPPGHGTVPNATVPYVGVNNAVNHAMFSGNNPQRRYQVQFALGIMSQEKLIPTKFMASQLAIEITLANVAECMYVNGGTLSTPLSYTVKNVNLIPEILEFDASYDESFLRGLQSGGVPIKFATWNQYRFSTSNSSSMNLQIQERSRSVKAIFAVQRRDGADLFKDSGATFFNTDLSQTIQYSQASAANASTMQEYQFRIGGRYFPSQAVQCSTEVGGKISNGGAEAWVEMSKALNVLGDYRLSSSVNTKRWAAAPQCNITGTTLTANSTVYTFDVLSEYDYDFSLIQNTAGGLSYIRQVASGTSAQSGTLGSACFGIAIDLETSNGLEISGLNAEEQSDISLIARYSASQGNASNSMVFDVFTYVDQMIVLRENNVLELIQ